MLMLTPSASHLPTLVLEVSYSQNTKKLAYLADSYIVDSQHAIRCVVGLDITYPKSKRKDEQIEQDKTALVHIWRPGTEMRADGEEVGVCRTDLSVPFRDAAGAACHGSLEIQLADLLPSNITSSELEQDDLPCISIPFATLADVLSDAERTANAKTPGEGTTARKSSMRFCKRKRTPSEELSDGREQAFLRQEQAELEKDEQADGEWRARRRRRVEGERELVAGRKKSLRGRADGAAG